MRDDYTLYQQKKHQEQQDRADQISREQQELHNNQKELAYEKSRQLSQKYERGQEAKSTLNNLERQKQDEWNRHHKDETNKRQSLALQQEQQALKQEHHQMVKQQKDYYKNNLQNQMMERDYQTKAEKDEDVRKEKMSNGFEFECYTRDQMIARERNSTKHYLKNQQQVDHFKKDNEVQAVRSLPPSFVSVDKVNQMQNEAKQEVVRHKKNLNEVMRNQYSEAVTSKKERARQEKAQAEAEMRQQVVKTQEQLAAENHQRRVEKQGYGSYLRSQIGQNESAKKQQFVADHDPSTHHNLRRVTKVLACEDCDAVLGKHGYLEEMSEHE